MTGIVSKFQPEKTVYRALTLAGLTDTKKHYLFVNKLQTYFKKFKAQQKFDDISLQGIGLSVSFSQFMTYLKYQSEWSDKEI